jgi:hypothetical protein
MGVQKTGHPLDKHIDDGELRALVFSPSETGQELQRLSSNAIREAECHIRFCEDCSTKVEKYRQLVNRSVNVAFSQVATPEDACPQDRDIDWVEVAAGLWPESRAEQLIQHAAQCAHCGPLLRSAICVNDDPTPEEEKLLAELKAPYWPVEREKTKTIPTKHSSPSVWHLFLKWKIFVPITALMVIIGMLYLRSELSTSPISGAKFAEFAVGAHRQYAQGNLALDVFSDSQQALNGWLKANSPFPLALPASPMGPGEERPYRLEGARLVRIGSKTAAYIAYQMQTEPVSLMVTPDSVAVASGGVQVDFKKLSFHYRMVEGYKVVTWSVHGLTYALVSREGNTTQQSCMVCHSAMRDRELSRTPTPLRTERTAHPVLQ